MQHVASDIGLGQKYLPSESYPMQDQLNNIANWAEENPMKLNEQKYNYMIFFRAQENLITRLHINKHTLNQIPVT